MNFMTPWGPVHFCADEARMLLYGALGCLPFFGAAIAWLRAKCKGQHKKDCCKH